MRACLDGRVSAALDAARHERKEFGRTLRIAGYAALFGRPDGARDTILPGAFRRTLGERRSGLGGRYPLYWQHRPEQRIGWVEAVGEDERGLRIIASVDNPDGRAAAMLRARAVSGLSFGYRARSFRRSEKGRELAEIELFEVSVVTHPMQHGARVHFVSDPPRHGEGNRDAKRRGGGAPWKAQDP